MNDTKIFDTNDNSSLSSGEVVTRILEENKSFDSSTDIEENKDNNNSGENVFITTNDNEDNINDSDDDVIITTNNDENDNDNEDIINDSDDDVLNIKTRKPATRQHQRSENTDIKKIDKDSEEKFVKYPFRNLNEQDLKDKKYKFLNLHDSSGETTLQWKLPNCAILDILRRDMYLLKNDEILSDNIVEFCQSEHKLTRLLYLCEL